MDITDCHIRARVHLLKGDKIDQPDLGHIVTRPGIWENDKSPMVYLLRDRYDSIIGEYIDDLFYDADHIYEYQRTEVPLSWILRAYKMIHNLECYHDMKFVPVFQAPRSGRENI